LAQRTSEYNNYHQKGRKGPGREIQEEPYLLAGGFQAIPSLPPRNEQQMGEEGRREHAHGGKGMDLWKGGGDLGGWVNREKRLHTKAGESFREDGQKNRKRGGAGLLGKFFSKVKPWGNESNRKGSESTVATHCSSCR